MVYYCKYCGAKIIGGGTEMCTHCREKLSLIRDIKTMLRPYYESKKARERAENYGYYKDLYKH